MLQLPVTVSRLRWNNSVKPDVCWQDIVRIAGLNILFCKNGNHAYGNISGLKFTCTRRFGISDELHDFKMELLEYEKVI